MEVIKNDSFAQVPEGFTAETIETPVNNDLLSSVLSAVGVQAGTKPKEEAIPVEDQPVQALSPRKRKAKPVEREDICVNADEPSDEPCCCQDNDVKLSASSPYQYISNSFEKMDEFRRMVDGLIEKFDIDGIIKVIKTLELGWAPNKYEIMKVARDLAFDAVMDSKNRYDKYGIAERMGLKVVIHTKENADAGVYIEDKVSVVFEYIAVKSASE